MLSAKNQAVNVLQDAAADEAALSFIVEGKPYWSHVSRSNINDNMSITWLLAGTLPNWGGTPLVVVVALEENNPTLAKNIGNDILDTASNK